MTLQQAVGTSITCNVCGGGDIAVFVRKDGYDVHRCGGCGLAFTYPQPESLEEQYDSSYFDLYRRRRDFRLRRADRRLQSIEMLASPGKLLDIGCSLGYFVEAANARGWKASGVEISTAASGEARELGLDVRAGALEDAAYPDESFDCVTMWDVLEHVSDPTAHMLEVHRVLAPGGIVAIGTPDLDHWVFRLRRERWRHLKPAEHIYYFGHASLARLLRKTGFEPVRPMVFGGRPFPGRTRAACANAMARLFKPKDVLTLYGVKQ